MLKKLEIIIFLLFTLLFTSCKHKNTEQNNVSVVRDLKQIIASDTLFVGTMYGPTSYFNFRDEFLGFDFEMATNLAKELNVNLKITIAENESELFDLLESQKIDLVCSKTIETKALKQKFKFVFPQSPSYLVLVQNRGTNAISNVIELANKTVYVNPNSIYSNRLEALNNEIGGTINIVNSEDSISNDDLIDMVGENKIKYTIAYHDIATLHKSYFSSLDCRMPIGFEQSNGWLILPANKDLLNAINNWTGKTETEDLKNRLIEKYWRKSPYFALKMINIPKGAISPYDRLFRKYAPLIGWDWRLLAALAFHESRFNPNEKSWVGAAGLMQLMPRTAANFGLSKTTILDPELNIEAGVQYIKSLNMTFRHVEDKNERIKFILAGYNSGPAHVLDAMALAKKYGKNNQMWFGNVEYFLLKKSEPQYYNDKVVKYGYFRGNQTVRYVQNCMETFEKYLRKK